jgi:hypothetical protein
MTNWIELFVPGYKEFKVQAKVFEATSDIRHFSSFLICSNFITRGWRMYFRIRQCTSQDLSFNKYHPYQFDSFSLFIIHCLLLIIYYSFVISCTPWIWYRLTSFSSAMPSNKLRTKNLSLQMTRLLGSKNEFDCIPRSVFGIMFDNWLIQLQTCIIHQSFDCSEP